MSTGDATGRESLECTGAPRDVGRAQARQWGASLEGAFRQAGAVDRWRHRVGWPSPGVRALVRQVRRHAPHQAETLSQLSRSAGVPLSWLVAQLSGSPGGAKGPVPPAVAVESRSGGPAARDAWLAGAFATGLRVRRSRPDGCFASVELCWPWLSSALAGVNEAGLAVVCRPGTLPVLPSGPPPLLLVQDCLERFDRVTGALDWCTGRPAAGDATLLFADASGEAAAVVFRADERRVLRPAEGLLVAVDGLGGTELALAKTVGDAPGLDRAARSELRLGRSDLHVVKVNPAERRIVVWNAEGREPAAYEAPVSTEVTASAAPDAIA